MNPLRPAALALAALSLIGPAGCRTAGVDNVVRSDVQPPRPKLTAAQLLTEHNANAARVKSLEAKPGITASDRRTAGGLSGKLALELPRNFKLDLESPLQKYADIGSNDKEFWFWVKGAKEGGEKAIYFCNYDESGASPLASSLQPDWIIEALGLRVIDNEEAARIEVTPGKTPGTLTLTQRQTSPQGETLLKETILSEQTHKILEHRIYQAEGKKLLARAALSEYMKYSVGDASGEDAETVYLPKKIRLEWLQENLVLNVSMKEVQVNPRFTTERRQALFTEPRYDNFVRVNLAERVGAAAPRSSAPTSVRETMPAPPARVRLAEPGPLGFDGMSRNPLDPAERVAGLATPSERGVEEVIGAPIPSGDGPAATRQVARARSGWRGALAAGLER
jgi:hypothetical protein